MSDHEARQEPPSCLLCRGAGVTDLPTEDGPEEFPCPVCRPWPHRFPGYAMLGRWVVPPYEPGETPAYYPPGTGPSSGPTRLTARERAEIDDDA